MDTSFLNKWHTAIKGCRHSVFVYAYTNLNVGDDLFIHKLVSAYPDIRFVLMAKKPYGKMFSRYRNVTVHEEDSLSMKVFKMLRIDDRIQWRIPHECDYAVLIGGSVFKEDSKWENQPLWYRDLFDHDRLYFLGCNWGPCRTKDFKEAMTAVFSDIKDICFRDRRSCDEFSQLQNVRYAPDILFGFDWSPYREIPEEKQVLISVINCRSDSADLAEYASAYNAFIGQLTAQFAERGYRIVLCPFCEGEGDLEAAEEIRSCLQPEVRKHVSVVRYCGTNIEQILHLIAASEYVVATRFHAMILGLVAGKKVLPVIYHVKLRNVLKDLSFQGRYCDIWQLPEDTSDIIEGITQGICASDREQLARLSAGHFERLSEILQ